MKFNNEQQEIINNIFGAYLVNAPVGTGKTTVLTERIIKAIEQGIKPSEILALTFTNRASEEMKSRIKERINDKNDYDALNINTFHGFCAYFIKAESKSININSDFIILDEDDQLDLVRNILSKEKKIFIENKNDIYNILESIYKYRVSLMQLEMGHNIKLKELEPELINFSQKYLEELSKQNALDFNELVLLTLKTLINNREINEKWSNRFRFIQLDEFQDTHLSEYLVIKELAKKHKNISFIGDIDQTIYSFRDSQPVFIAQLFKNHFNPVKEMSLRINYRSNPELIKVFLSVLNNMEKPQTKELSDYGQSHDSEGQKYVHLFRAYNFSEEVLWSIDNIKKIKDKDPDAKIAVLNRTNKAIKDIAEIFSQNKISFLTVDQYDFFKRKEIKDILAYLKILINKNDLFSAKRLIERPAKNIGEESLNKINDNGRDCGLNISDFLSFKNYNFVEPYQQLISQHDNGRIIVLDTETTGVNPSSDEIVQVYARELVNGKLGKEFHHYLKNKKSVGSAYFVHKISDEFLKEKGEDPKKILKNLKDFIGDSIVCGHNIIFDLNMIKENSKRHNINIDFKNYYDTLDLSRRFLNLDSYKLSNIAKYLNFKNATHSADDDVAATIDLLLYLIKILKNKLEERTNLWNKFKNKFINISSSIYNWEKELDKKRPDELLDFIWVESGLKDYYQDKNFKQRERSFQTLKKFFETRDDLSLTSRSSLHNLLHFSGLLKNIDFLGLEQGKIPIVTIHQVKGLEFDYIFILGLNEGSFPIFKSDNLEEEKRLFYVALTRARKEIFLSYSNFNQNNYPASKSRLINLIKKDYLEDL